MARSSAVFERRVRLDGSFNFRDLGGYPTRGSRTVRPGRLYRADGPHALTDADHVTLEGLGLRTVIDLRSNDEVVTRPSYLTTLPDVVGYRLPLLDVIPNTEELRDWTDPLLVAARYREMVEQGSDSIAEALKVLSDPSAYPALFHCTAGKDRTGVLAAIVLGLLDASDVTIVTDYTASRAPMAAYVAYLRAAHPDAQEVLKQLAPAILDAHPAAITVFIEGIRHDYGSFDGLAADLGVPNAASDLRTALLT